MTMAKPFNPFDIYKPAERTVHIKALNSDVTLRDLTMVENDELTKLLLKGFSGKGEPTVDMEQATLNNYKKIAMALIEPKVTVEELQALGTKAADAIVELVKVIDGREDEPAEGNEN
jgi:hypothetical protein